MTSDAGAAPAPRARPDPRSADPPGRRRARPPHRQPRVGERAREGAAKLDAQGKIYVRDRIALLFDEGSFVEDGRYANALPAGPARRRRRHRPRHRRRPPGDRHRQRPDGQGRLVGRAHRREDRARHRDGAARGAAGLLVRRLRRRPDHRPGRDVPGPPRRRADLPQPGRALGQGAADLLPLRPVSAAGGAYIPSFCDLIIMVEGNASMYLGSPRMAEMVVGEKVTLEEMGGARMHCTVSGVGDLLAARRHRGHRARQALLLLRARQLARPRRRRMPPRSRRRR